MPIWVQWVQALGIPITSAAIAGAGAFIALQQKRLADIRLQLDLYDRRFKVFEAARNYLIAIIQGADAQRSAYSAFISGTSESVFLFNGEVVDYLEHLKAATRKQFLLTRKLNNQHIKDEDFAKFSDEMDDLEEWFDSQFGVLVTKFKPFLRLDEHRRARR